MGRNPRQRSVLQSQSLSQFTLSRSCFSPQNLKNTGWVSSDNKKPKDREQFFSLIRNFNNILEIGPFDKLVTPKYKKDSAIVEYADYMSTDELKARASLLPDRIPANVPHISYIIAESFTASINKKFDCVFSSHVLEHIPNLVKHFQEIQSILNPGGTYLFILPDKRYCFDAFISESTLPEVITSYFERRKKPSLRSVIEHRAFTVHNYKYLPGPQLITSREIFDKIQDAINEFNENDYVDVHCWQFTPESLEKIVNALIRLELISHHWNIQIFELNGEIGGYFQLLHSSIPSCDSQ